MRMTFINITAEELSTYEISENDDNDRIDNTILDSVYNEAVHLLVNKNIERYEDKYSIISI